MLANSIHPRKPPRQARSAATVELILEAATRVLSTDSLSGFTTNRVAEVAGVSIGSLYQYFANKSALVACLIEREQAALAKAVLEVASSRECEPLPQVLAALIDVGIAHQFGAPLYAAALDHEEQRLPLQLALSAAQRQMVEAIHKVLQKHFPNSSAESLYTAASDCLTITKALIETEATRKSVSLSSLRSRVLHALLGYLFHDSQSLGR